MTLIEEIEEAADRHRNSPRRWEHWRQPDYDSYILTESSRWPRIKAALEAAQEMERGKCLHAPQPSDCWFCDAKARFRAAFSPAEGKE